MRPAALAELVRSTAVQVLAAQRLDTSVLPETITVERPRNPEHGDYASNVAMQVAGKTGAAPRQVAGWLADALARQGAITSATVAGPGFVNLRLAAEAQADTVQEVLDRVDMFGSGDLYRGMRVELGLAASSDLAGVRCAAVGEALVRIFSAQGAEIVRTSPRHEGTRTERGCDLRLYLVDADQLQSWPEVIGRGAEVLIGQRVRLVRSGRPLPPSVTMDDLADAGRYALVRSAVDAPLEVDLDLIGKHRNDNPAYSVQYAHARLAALRRNAEALSIDWQAAECAVLALLTGEPERQLIRTLSEYPDIVRESAQRRKPQRVARYLEDLAIAVDGFFGATHLLQPGDDRSSPLTAARLRLCEATRQVLAGGLGLLGVGAPERM